MGHRRIRAGAGLLAISTLIQLLGIWLGRGPVDGSGNAAWLGVALGTSTWLLVQPWRRRVMVLAVVVTTLWSAVLALVLASQLVDQGTPSVGLGLIALVIGGVGLALLPFAEAWAAVLAVIVRVAAGTTLLVGLASAIMGGAHLAGVLGNAQRGAYYTYDFRLGSMLSIGIMMVVAGLVCIAAAGGLARGQRRAWDHAMGGTILLLLVTVPLVLVPRQGQLAASLVILAAPNLVVLLVARRRLAAA